MLLFYFRLFDPFPHTTCKNNKKKEGQPRIPLLFFWKKYLHLYRPTATPASGRPSARRPPWTSSTTRTRRSRTTPGQSLPTKTLSWIQTLTFFSSFSLRAFKLQKANFDKEVNTAVSTSNAIFPIFLAILKFNIFFKKFRKPRPSWRTSSRPPRSSRGSGTRRSRFRWENETITLLYFPSNWEIWGLKSKKKLR